MLRGKGFTYLKFGLGEKGMTDVDMKAPKIKGAQKKSSQNRR